jgi:hypothetical protein
LCDLVFAFRSEPRSTHFRLLDFLHRLIRPASSLVFFDQCTRCRLHFLFRLFLQSPWSHRSFSILPLSPVSFGRWWLSLRGALFSLVPFLCVLADLFSCAPRAVDPVFSCCRYSFIPLQVFVVGASFVGLAVQVLSAELLVQARGPEPYEML